jgi:hypothetical protein
LQKSGLGILAKTEKLKKKIRNATKRKNINRTENEKK